jgi:serine/threonine protein kinase
MAEIEIGFQSAGVCLSVEIMVPDAIPPAPPAPLASAAPPDPLRPPTWLRGGLRQTVISGQPGNSEQQLAEIQAEFPHLRISSMLGRGGMGVVYLAEDLIVSRPVALKVLSHDHQDGDESAARFAQEAAALKRLNHEHIVRLVQAGTSPAGWPYLIMEYVPGEDLGARLHTLRTLPAELALRIAYETALALAYAHTAGVIHRDIKPSNILLTAEGSVKVADFGLASLENEAGLSGLTQGFHLMGSQDYQSPEALLVGAEVDGRADLYAVGVMLYHMLTGQVPRGIFPLPSKVNRKLDPRIDLLVTNLLQQNPYERTASALDLSVALHGIIAMMGEAPPEQPVPSPRRRWWSRS